ncbi:phage tail terminator family protein [Paenibacillus glycanilyticus]|uniref:Uncharacterized protein n=1 Tax=Paenibacillus glycanilyticus TaxID=126569 RepID=A0ABQ6NJE0_9BACL|nr:hypothetical protein [Paenibacillus glycanilyticus]GMK45216.1 hypothetical protein PghCCS26_23440 [Paenibacillus glycanilyticus]
MQISINDVRHAVIQTLINEFPLIPVSGDDIKQVLEPPCFYVKLLESTHRLEPGNRYHRDFPFLILYSGTDGNEDLYDVAERLTSSLQVIAVEGGPFNGANMRHQIVEGALHFNVDYSCTVSKEATNIPRMMTLQQTGGIKA